MKWTEAHVKKLKADGKIRDYTVTTPSKSAVKIPSTDCKEVQWMHQQLVLFQMETGHKLIKEMGKWHPERKWRFDFAFPEKYLAIEYEGIIAQKSRHTSITGYTGDSEKYNEAQRLGWRVLRYTALNYKNVIQDLNNILNT